jgi:hypothetical protein
MDTVNLRLGHLNIWRESNDREAYADLNTMAPFCDVLQINEGRKHVDDVRRFCDNNPIWMFFTARDAKENPTPNEMNNIIMVRKDTIKVHGVATKQMCGKVAGSPDRHMLTMRATHLQSNQPLRLRVTHMNSHVEKQSWHRLPRFPQYQIHTQRIVERMTNSSFDLDFLSADVNANYRNKAVRNSPLFPYYRLRRNDIPCNYDILGMPEMGTHGSRLIDAWFLQLVGKATVVRQKVVTGLKSDHNGLVVVVAIQVRNV